MKDTAKTFTKFKKGKEQNQKTDEQADSGVLQQARSSPT